jgi:lipopolysaccharide transport system permease protein
MMQLVKDTPTEEIPPTQGSTSQSGPPGDAQPVTVIEPRPGWRFIDFRELWQYRELLYFLAWRDLKVRYKQTALGAAWAVLQPLATMIVFTLFLGKVAGISTGDIPYPLFVFAGTLPWTFFANSIASSGQTVVGNKQLVTKIYFPRLLMPFSAIGPFFLDFLIALGVFGILMCWYGVAPGWWVVLAPVTFLGLTLAALGVGTLLAALTVAYRDFRYVVPFGVQLWMFATPCIYMQAEQVVGPRGQALLPLNPAYGLISNFRQVMLGGSPDWYSLVVSGGMAVVLVCVGCFYFRRAEGHFADII